MICILYGSVLGLDQSAILAASLVEALIETAVLTMLANRYLSAD